MVIQFIFVILKQLLYNINQFNTIVLPNKVCFIHNLCNISIFLHWIAFQNSLKILIYNNFQSFKNFIQNFMYYNILCIICVHLILLWSPNETCPSCSAIINCFIHAYLCPKLKKNYIFERDFAYTTDILHFTHFPLTYIQQPPQCCSILWAFTHHSSPNV